MTDNCFHCDLPVAKNLDYECEVLGSNRHFCCAGCLAIAEILVENNLTNFYRFRDSPSRKAETLIPQELQNIKALDNLSVLEEISTETEDTRSIELGLDGITCAACGWLIEKKLSTLPQVKQISVNVSTQRATLSWDKSQPLSKILKTLVDLGYRAYPFSEDAREQSFESVNRTYIKRLLVAGLGMMQVMTYALAIYIGEFQDISDENQSFLYWISGIVATPVIFYSAKPFFQSALRNLAARQLGMNLPVSIAILSAYSASVYSLIFDGHIFYFDSVVMFTFFLLIGRFLEHRARYRSLLKQQNFKQLMPLSVARRNTDQSITTIGISDILPGDILVIHAGGIIPVDGSLLEGAAEVNESVITGEFMPIKKQIGDKLSSGSSNHSASIVMRVSQDFAHSHIQKLIQLQQNAEQMKPDSVSLADRISHWYVFILLILVVASGIYWWQVSPSQAFSIILSVLVVSCPCALSLATPAAIAAATSQLSDLGFMIRSKTALSHLAKVTEVYFDKTGTLTTASMQIKEVILFTDTNQEQCIQIASSLENISDHPVAKAFKNEVANCSASDLRETIGKGVTGIINSKRYRLGNEGYAFDEQSNNTALPAVGFETHLYLVCNNSHIATFVLQDSLKESAKPAIAKLIQQSLDVILLSGDSAASVANTAARLKIKKHFANSSPEGKLAIILNAQSQQKNCLMVGDGFNDIGALGAANVSITMASGTSVSKTASDAVLVANDLNVIPQSIAIAHKVQKIIRQNLSWAVFYNITAIPFAMMGLVPAWLAAIGMSLSSLVVVLNALRLRK